MRGLRLAAAYMMHDLANDGTGRAAIGAEINESGLVNEFVSALSGLGLVLARRRKLSDQEIRIVLEGTAIHAELDLGRESD